MNKLKAVLIVSALTCCFGTVMAQVSISWNEVYPGIWKAVIGTPEKISLLKAADIHPNTEALSQLPKVSFPLNQDDISASLSDGKVYLRFPLEKEEQLYGLGLNFKSVNRRGSILTLHSDHFGGEDNGRNHAPVPFYISSRGYGVLVDVARYITVYAGTAVRVDAKHPPELQDRNTDKNWIEKPYSDAVEMLVPVQGAEVYVFAGPTPMNVVQRYNLMNGGGYLPPKWVLGFTQAIPTLYTQADIVKEVKEFEEHHFPLWHMVVDCGWQSMTYPSTFEWDKQRFPDPKAFIDALAKEGVKANLWFHPYVSPASSLYPKIKPYTGSHTVWNGVVPDFSMPEARQIFKEHFLENHIDIVAGFKIDEVDGFDFWLWPDVATFPSGLTGEQMRQLYGIFVQQMTGEWFKEKNQRTYGLVRASNAGSSSFPYVIYNDYYNHKDYITALINSSFIGVLWNPEVRTSKTAEEWVRRMQTACFSPMAFLDAWEGDVRPWSFPEVEKAVNDVVNLRMQLLPYIYNAFAQYHFEGIPPFRAMNLVEGFGFKSTTREGKLDATENPYAMSIREDIKDQYMMGDAILVAPVFTGEKSRKVYLPAGKWYDFYTGALAGENQEIEITATLDKIPLFVKDGAIIPMIPAQLKAPTPEQKLPLELRHYGHSEGSLSLYDDDGSTFDYEKGAFSITKFSVTKNAKGQLSGTMEKPKANKPFGYKKEVVWKFMTK